MDYEQALKAADRQDAPGTEIVRVNPLDLDRAKDPFKKYEVKIREMGSQADALVVKDDATALIATEMAAQIHGILKDLELARKNVVAEPDQFVRGVNTFVRNFRSALENITRGLKKKLGDHSARVEFKRREAEKKAKDEADAKQKEIDDAAKKIGIDPPKLPKPAAPKKKTPVRSASGSSSTRMVWTFEVVDADKVPRKYLTPDEKAIAAAVKGGIRSIEGVRIFEKPKVSIRGSR